MLNKARNELVLQILLLMINKQNHMHNCQFVN